MALLTLEIAGHSFGVGRVHGESRLGGLFRYTVHASLGDSPAAADLLGQPFKLGVHDGFGQVLTVQGVTMRVERSLEAAGASYVLILGPDVGPLAVGRDSRVFQDVTVVDIVKKVLDEAGITADKIRWATNSNYRKRVYCAQHRESDLAFIERLLAEEGIYTWFEHGDESTIMVFADDSTAAPELEGGAELPFHDDSSLRPTRDYVVHVSKHARMTPDAVRIRDYNFDKPRLVLDSQAGSGPIEVYDSPGRFGVPDEGAHLAEVRLQALRARRSELLGEAATMRLRPGLVFELTGHPTDALNGRYLITSTTLDASDWAGGTGGDFDRLRVAWTAIPAATPFRTAQGPRVAGSPAIARPGGPQTGVVVGPPGEEIHPDKSGRVRVQFYWDREGQLDDKASTWMRVGQFALGGSMILPRVGWEVLVQAHEGDVDQPFVQSHLYDGQHPVPYALPANKTRTAWQTATTPGGGSSNEIRFEDKAGSEEMFVNASKDMNVVIGDNSQEKIAVDHTHDIGANHDVSISANSKVSVGAKQDAKIGGSETLSVSGERTVVVSGSETATIGGSRSVTAISGCKLEAKGARSLTVGGTMTAVAATEVARAVLGSLSVTVGGSWIQAGVAGVSDMTVGAGAETVGGAKISVGAAGVSTNVKGALAETVGGAYVIAAGGNAGEGATGTLAITVGGALIANAPKVLLEAASEISIRVGGASLTITSSSVEVKAPSLASPGATISKTAGQIHHN